MKIANEHIYNYLLSGRVLAIFHNTDTGNQLNVVIKLRNIGVWYVYHDNVYIGYIRGDIFIKRSLNDERTVPASILLAMKQFNWVWKQVVNNTLPVTMEVMHSGACGHCGRKLTDAVSIIMGVGPECKKKLGFVTQLKLQLHESSTNS